MAIEGGARLAEARESCEHGEWTPFLAAIGVHARTARDWIALHRSGFKPATVAVLGGLRATLELVRVDPDATAQLAAALDDTERLREELAELEAAYHALAERLGDPVSQQWARDLWASTVEICSWKREAETWQARDAESARQVRDLQREVRSASS